MLIIQLMKCLLSLIKSYDEDVTGRRKFEIHDELVCAIGRDQCSGVWRADRPQHRDDHWGALGEQGSRFFTMSLPLIILLCVKIK